METRKRAKQSAIKSSFSGPGRVLESGEVVSRKRPSSSEDERAQKKRRMDSDYITGKEDENSSGEEDMEAATIVKNNLGDVIQTDTNRKSKEITLKANIKEDASHALPRQEENSDVEDSNITESGRDAIGSKDMPKTSKCNIRQQGDNSSAGRIGRNELASLLQHIHHQQLNTVPEGRPLARGSTRSGRKRGFWRYGEGYRLGDSEK